MPDASVTVQPSPESVWPSTVTGAGIQTANATIFVVDHVLQPASNDISSGGACPGSSVPGSSVPVVSMPPEVSTAPGDSVPGSSVPC